MENFAAFMGIIAGFIVLLILVSAVAGAVANRAIGREKADPESLLAQRFAKGEISEAEYERALSVLRLGPRLEFDDRDLR